MTTKEKKLIQIRETFYRLKAERKTSFAAIARDLECSESLISKIFHGVRGTNDRIAAIQRILKEAGNGRRT